MTDEEWAFFERFIHSVRAPNGRKPTNHRLVLEWIFWIARTGAPWRDLPKEFGKWSSGYHCRSRVETEMHYVKLLGQRLAARDFDRQVAEFQICVAVLNGFTALGIPVTEAVG